MIELNPGFIQTSQINQDNPMTNIKVSSCNWIDCQTAVSEIRMQVFVMEQLVPLDLEFDGLDQTACHWLAKDSRGQPVGTARLLNNGHIGRMAVLRPYRNNGVGSAIMRSIVAHTKQAGLLSLHLNAQITAEPFYQHLGFSRYGEEFMDAGIPHIAMAIKLLPKN